MLWINLEVFPFGGMGVWLPIFGSVRLSFIMICRISFISEKFNGELHVVAGL